MLTIKKRTYPLEEEGKVNRLNSELMEEKERSAKYEKALAETSGPVATAFHAVGEYITVNGVFCEVTDAICVGETINMNRNVKTVSIGAVLSALKGE